MREIVSKALFSVVLLASSSAAAGMAGRGVVPGHGGIFDRTDNLLIATPVLYYYFRFFLTGTTA